VGECAHSVARPSNDWENYHFHPSPCALLPLLQGSCHLSPRPPSPFSRIRAHGQLCSPTRIWLFSRARGAPTGQYALNGVGHHPGGRLPPPPWHLARACQRASPTSRSVGNMGAVSCLSCAPASALSISIPHNNDAMLAPERAKFGKVDSGCLASIIAFIIAGV
jgi:hypothetical protein